MTHDFWGVRGAGCLIRAEASGRLLVGLRSEEVNEPLTWGTWGGAVDPGENPETAVRREVAEETGYEGALRLSHLHTYRHVSGFVYDTFLAEVPFEFDPVLGWETNEARWIKPGHWPRPLHFGLESVLLANKELLGYQKREALVELISGLRRSALGRLYR